MIFPELSSIRIKRQRLGIKQKELAEKSGVSQSLIAKLEKGLIEPSYSLTVRIFLTLESLEHKNEKKCYEVMSKKIIFLRKNDSVGKASELLKKHSISQIPVIEGKRAIGSISESIILDKLASIDRKKLFTMKVEDIMEESFPIVRAYSPLSSIIPLLKITSAVLISEKNDVKGIITKADLI